MYDLYSYNLETNELILQDSEYYSWYFYIHLVDWLDKNTPIFYIGETRSGATHSIAKVDVRFSNSYEALASQFAYQPHYSSELNTVYWSEQYFDSDGYEFLTSGWQIFERNLLADEVVSVAEYIYEEPRAGDLTVGHVVEANDSWIVVGDSYPLGFQTPIHFFDRATHELKFSYFSLPTTFHDWDIATLEAGLWVWEYDLESEETNYLLKRITIESDNIEETVITESNERARRAIYLSDDEKYLLMMQDGIIEVYNIEANRFYPVTLEPLPDYQIEAIWQPDNTLFVDVVRNHETIQRWHIQVEALNETDT